MIKKITPNDLRRMTEREGLILQGCGGDPKEWLDGVNEMLTEAGILLDGDKWEDVSVFEHDGHTNLLFNMDDIKLDIVRLAMWRLQTHSQFGGYWLSDWLPNKRGINTGSHQKEANAMLILSAKPGGYSPDQCGRTLTVGEMIRELECFDPDSKIYFSHNNGYTYSPVTENDFEQREEETEDEDLDESEDQGMSMT
jgi:hypothetical protein